jgi:predicted nucleotidyltransferase
MLCKNEIRILEDLFVDLTKENTISGISIALDQRYPQTHRDIEKLESKSLIKIKKIGQSKVVKLDFSSFHPEYSLVETERLLKKTKNPDLRALLEKLVRINQQFTCLLFGSYASGKSKKESDIDLLFIIPKEYEMQKFEKIVKNSLILERIDINIITEDSLFEMWSAPEKLNVGNEILKNHIVLSGSDYFIGLLGKKNVGR